MAKQKKITELPLAGSTKGLVTIGVDNTNKSVKVDIEALKAETINGTPSIRYDVAQNLTNGQKAQAKANMDVDATIATHNNSQSAHGNIVVKTIPQTLTAAQKEQARTNIGASTGGSGDIDTAIATHNANAAAHPDFVSRGRAGNRGGGNTYTATEIENMSDNLGHNAYGHNFTAMMQIGLQRVNTALRLQAIITKFGGTDTKMPGYYGFSLRNGSGGDTLQDPNDQYIPGFFCFSLNEEENKAAYPMKIVIYDGSGARKAYFKNGATPTLTAWKEIGGTTLSGYRDDWTNPDEATIPNGSTAESIYEWGFIKDGDATYNNAYQLLHYAYGQGYPAYVGTARQIRIWTNGVMETREKPPFNAWGEWQPVGGGSTPATTTQAGVVTLASNTGNSTDAGKVVALDINGCLPRAVVPEKRVPITLSSGGTVRLSDYPGQDVFVLTYTTASTNPPLVYLPSAADTRAKIKLQIRLTSTGASSPAIVLLYDASGTTTTIQANPNTTKTAFIVAEQFEANTFMIMNKVER